ncbi:MAG TPA: DUF805 domain-containing protein [Bacteroidales bacterium]|nr:DUF805 domain-containing protein [Bacteroidales bacterium]HQO08016.1 DUF805 domain-containing protein [Bacteroidales bacterium]HQP52512.1 DUF805 domain-containing protein [Bacteroidales bacterium]
MEWYLKCLRQYADFSGRARRKEYWMFQLFNVIFAFSVFLLGSLISGGFFATVLHSIYLLAVLIPSLAVTVRRLHDVGKSGGWILITLIPLIGLIWLIALLVTDSDEENQYGNYPK